MHLATYASVTDFLQSAQPTLERDEAANNLMLGVCLGILRDPTHFSSTPYFATISDGRGLVVAAVMTPPYRVQVYSPVDDYAAALPLLTNDLRGRGLPVPGVIGPSPISAAFADVWTAEAGGSYRVGTAMRVYELTAVLPTYTPPGTLRAATEADQSRVAQWLYDFHLDANVDTDIMTPERAANIAQRSIARRALYLWDDNGPVSMAAQTRATTHGCTVSLVFTPRELRGRGYASACVAALSRMLLASGYRFCSLFTDLANPTSNAIYQKMGYRPIRDFTDYVFLTLNR